MMTYYYYYYSLLLPPSSSSSTFVANLGTWCSMACAHGAKCKPPLAVVAPERDRFSPRRSPRMRAKKGTSDRRIRKQHRTRSIRRSVSSPYHALPFRSSSLGSFKAHDILSQSQPIYSRKAVSVLKTRNVPSTVSPISSPTRVNTKFVPRKRKVRSTRELEEYEELKEKYQQKKETSRKSLRKGFTFPRYAFNQTDEIVRERARRRVHHVYNLGLKFKPSPGVGTSLQCEQATQRTVSLIFICIQKH